MTDRDPFASLDLNEGYGASAPHDPFASIDVNEPYAPEGGPSTAGAFGRSAARGAAPAAGGLAGAGLGAELGSVAGPWGAVAGGFAGALLGGAAVQNAQDWAISQLPAKWKDPLEQSAREDEKAHPTASFLGGLAPFALTLSPVAAARKALPENATAIQRLMTHPATARLFGGAVMGGTELGQEAVSGEPTDWGKVAISTGFGMVFNRANALGEKIESFGARPAIALMSKKAAPTLAQANDMNVAGPGVTEDVFQGAHERPEQTARDAQEAARSESAALGEAPDGPSPHDVARRLEPELFAQYDDLAAKRDEFRKWIDEANNPPQEKFDELEAKRAELEAQLAATKNKDEQRRIRTRLRVDVQGEIDRLTARREAFANGGAQDTPELTAARQQLLAVDAQMRDMAPDVSAAYRRAADHSGAETVAAEPIPSEAGAEPAQEAPTAAPAVSETNAPATTPPAVTGRPLAEQKAFIAEDVKRQLIAAGRPADEAESAGHLIAARYATRAAQFKGSLGSAEELYRREGAEIRGPNGRSAFANEAPTYTPPSSAVEKLPPKPAKARPMTALEFIQQRGGIKDVGGDLKSLGLGKLSRNKGVISDKGMTPDYAREALAEAGYLGADRDRAVHETRLDDLHDALMDGRYSSEDQADVAAWNEYDAAKADKDRQVMAPKAAHDLLVEKVPFSDAHEPDPEIMGAARNLLVYGVEDDPVKAWDRAAFEHGREFAQSARGKINLSEGRRPVITLMKDANASTFIHESGHDFLEQIMRDADHPAAPDALKDDATTVRDWLGVNDASEIKTKHHEKFARGFEQYIREGVAPSKELAGVFAKFRNWLLGIYQTVKGLGKPINDDIRAVFDRMLSEEPNRTVIAPEREAAGPSLADVHEADANETEPHEAEPAMARVVAETTQHEAEKAHVDPNLVDPVARSAGIDAGAADNEGEGQTGDLGGNGGKAGPSPGVGANGKGTGPQLGRGGEAGRKGAGASTEPAGRSGEDDGPALAPKPATVFGPDESPFLDPAGNIRTENLTTREDVAQAIKDAAGENNDFLTERRGVISDGQVEELAEALGMDARTLSARKLGQAFNAEQVMAARKLLIRSATEVAEKMKKAATGTDQDVLAYAEAKDRHQMIQAQVAGITAEAGRALRAFRSIAGQGEEGAMAVDQFIKQATGKTLFQLRQEAQLGLAFETPEQVSKFMNDARTKTFGRMVLEYWINGLISGLATHTTYGMGNTILMLNKAGPETAAAAGIGALRKALGREGETVRFGEVGAQLGAAVKALPASLTAAADAARTGVTTLLPGEKPYKGGAMPMQPGSELAPAASLKEGATYHDALGAAFGLIRGMRDGFISAGALAKTGEKSPFIDVHYSPLGAIPDIGVGPVNIPLGNVLRAPGRMIAAIHSFFRATNYSMEKAAGAYRIAANEGLEGNALAARVGEIRQNPKPEQMEQWRDVSNDLTLMGHGGEFTRNISKLFNTSFDLPILGQTQVLKFISPFVHIASNVIDQSLIQRTPLGLLAPELRADLMGRNGNLAADKAAAKMLVGTALSITFGGLAAEGYVSGSGPSDPKESAMWRLAGNQPHSVRIGDMWYDMHRLGPMGMLLGMSADLYGVAHKASEGEMIEAASHLQHAITQNVLDESFMRGPADLIKAIEDPGRYGDAYIRNFVSSFTPFSVGMSQMARAQDPYSRQARTVLDAIRAKTPGLSQDLLPKRDIWGEPMRHDVAGVPGLSAIYETQVSRDPVNLAMLQLGISPAQVPRKIRNVDLTDQQYDDFSRLAGRMAKMRLDAIVKSPQFQTFPDHVRHDVIVETIKQSRESARGVMMMKNPSIMRQATEDKMSRLRGDDISPIE